MALFDNMSHHCSDVLEADKEEEGEAEAARRSINQSSKNHSRTVIQSTMFDEEGQIGKSIICSS